MADYLVSTRIVTDNFVNAESKDEALEIVKSIYQEQHKIDLQDFEIVVIERLRD